MLTIMEFNTANYNDHAGWNARLPLLVQAIIASGADIVGLSEIRLDPSAEFFYNEICQQFWNQYNLSPPDCGSLDTGQQILTLLQQQSADYVGATIVTNQAMVYSDGIWEGLSVISKLPIVDSDFVQLPACPTDSNKRITQWVQVQLSNGEVFSVYNTHFTLGADCLASNVEETLTFMGDRSSGAGVLIGDMNATPDNPALGKLGAAGLADVWAQAQLGNGYTFPSWNPQKRIDYCWASTAYSSRVTNVSLAATECSTGVLYASDHLALVASFDIN